MIHAAELSYELWAEAVSTAVYLKNLSPTTAVLGRTPEEAWTGKNPSIAHLRAFGCKAFAHIPDNQRTKLDPKTKECTFVGYSSNQKAYRLYDPVTKVVTSSRDVIFDEEPRRETRDVVTIDSEDIEESTSDDESGHQKDRRRLFSWYARYISYASRCWWRF